MLLEQLSQHKLDMILSDCPIDSTQQEGLFSVKLGESWISFWCQAPQPDLPFPACLEQRRLLIPGRRSMLGRKLLNWFKSQGLKADILGEFDDAALMKAFGEATTRFLSRRSSMRTMFILRKGMSNWAVDSVMEEYHVIFAERMIQHPAVQRICNKDYSGLFTPELQPQKNPQSRFFNQSRTTGWRLIQFADLCGQICFMTCCFVFVDQAFSCLTVHNWLHFIKCVLRSRFIASFDSCVYFLDKSTHHRATACVVLTSLFRLYCTFLS